jgi:UDP-N-acetylmuramoyl-L-alanyl-D-glutamate--2,6-diaminopimelate ligase
MRLDEIIRGIAITDRRGAFDLDITRISTDSRQVGPGTLFVALKGSTHDGHAFIPAAVLGGASAVLAERWPETADVAGRPAVVLVPNARKALALCAANLSGQPSRRLVVAGVTGTNGKTTVTYVLESIIQAASRKVGVIGTIESRWNGHSEPVEHTTPEPARLQATLARMLADDVSHVVMEVSSHALDQQRVAGVNFKVAGFTNLTQDHLDYHGSMDAYFEAKSRLFSEGLRRSRARGRMAVVNLDDPRAPALLERWGGKSLTVSLRPDSGADIAVLSATYGLEGTAARVRTSKGVWDLQVPLVGEHNLSNALVAVGMALAMGFSRVRILRGLESLRGVPGRLERVVAGEAPRTVFVDYAHTPDALRKVLGAVGPLVRGRLVVVFGCGGNRDADKRAPMGRAVGDHADIAYLTSDNPRGEDPAAIAAAAEQGLREAGWTAASGAPGPRTYRVELDRRAAIRAAVADLGPDDCLVIAGKGHETFQLLGKRRIHFDDREEARHALLGHPAPPPLVFEDSTGEIEAEQVVEAVELIEGAAIIEAVSEVGVSAMTVPAESIVDSVDLDPDVVGEDREEKSRLVTPVEVVDDAAPDAPADAAPAASLAVAASPSEGVVFGVLPEAVSVGLAPSPSTPEGPAT